MKKKKKKSEKEQTEFSLSVAHLRRLDMLIRTYLHLSEMSICILNDIRMETKLESDKMGREDKREYFMSPRHIDEKGKGFGLSKKKPFKKKNQ